MVGLTSRDTDRILQYTLHGEYTSAPNMHHLCQLKNMTKEEALVPSSEASLKCSPEGLHASVSISDVLLPSSVAYLFIIMLLVLIYFAT